MLGPSGSGKSTLLRIAAGFDRPSAGVARTLGVDLGAPRRRAGWRRSARGTSASSTSTTRASLSPALTCAENVELPLRLAGVADARARAPRARAAGASGARRARRTTCPQRSRAASSSGSPPAPRSRTRPRSCSPTSPPASSTRAPPPASTSCSASSRPRDGTTLVVVSHDEAAAELADRVVHVRDGRISAEALRGGAPARLVVGRGGWVRLPARRAGETGIGAPRGLAASRDGERRARGRGAAARRGRATAAAPAPRRAEIVVAAARGRQELRRRRAGAGARRLRRRASHAGELVALEGRSGLGQDDAPAPARRPRAARRRLDRGRRPRARRRSTASSSPRTAATTSAGSARSPA